MVRWLRYVALGFLPARWRLPSFVALGAFAGLGAAAVHLSRAPSYMSDAPETCMNCHVMTTQYMTWQHSSHGRVTTCVDCHVPHDSLVSKYAFKAQDGMKHSYVFTMRQEPQVIRMSQAAIPVVEANCRRCHANVVGEVHLRAWQPGDNRCWDCHRETPHGSHRSLSAAPDALRPALPTVFSDPRIISIGGAAPRPASETTQVTTP